MADDSADLVKSRLIPVVVIDDAGCAEPLGRALMAGGLPVVEVTLRSPAAVDAIRAMVDAGLTEGPDPMLVGAGTVLTTDQVDAAVDAGAKFIVSPGLSRTVVERSRERDIPVVAGAVTATEVQASLELGLDLVKFFPSASSGGPATIKALAAPFPQVRFIPTGGVNPDNLADHLSLPNVPAVGGSWMVPPDLVRAAAVDELQSLAAEAVALAAAVPEES